MLRLHDCHERNDQFNSRAFKEAIEIIESYIFRRSVCDMQTRSLNQIFASLSYTIQDDDPLTSLKVALYRSGKKRRFPSDIEFCDALTTRDIYSMRHHFYLLDRLENDSKEKIDTTSFTVEHVLPQNQNLGASWRAMLGSDWKTIQETWLHRLGNLTLTGYNSEYSDRSFIDKKTMEKGFDESPLRINHFIRESTKWTVTEIEERGKRLSKQASKIWPMLVVDIDTVRQVELEEHQVEGSNFSVDSIGFDTEARALFDNIRPQILALGDDVFEQCREKSVVYRVFDHFVEILPRAKYILLLVNIDFEDTDDPSGNARDASDRAFVSNASESGGVLFSLRKNSQSIAAMHVLQQAYERVTE
jgi:predicted transport protein